MPIRKRWTRIGEDLVEAARQKRLKQGKQWAKALRKNQIVFKNLSKEEQKRVWKCSMTLYNKRRRKRTGTVAFNVRTQAFRKMLAKKQGE